VWFVDAVRFAVVVFGLLNSAVLVRLMWLRWQRRAPNLWEGSANYFTMSGLILLMLVAIARRLDSLGDAPDWWLWASAFGVALVSVGLSRTVTIPTYRRRVNTPTGGKHIMNEPEAPEPDQTDTVEDQGEPQPVPYTEDSVQDDGEDIEDPPGFDDAAFDGSDNA
jgi:hypothetical protein